jgi:flavin-dependent dehydrogenase
MDRCDVLIAGGGPAGSACAWKLRRSGLDVLVVDRATFPRDKVCAGWITPPVLSALEIDVDEYRCGRTFQPITAFLTGIIGSSPPIRTAYDHPVSYGIRRCEFDHYLLQRSGARQRAGTAVEALRRSGDRWIVNDDILTPMVVGAGGHFCAVARCLNGPRRSDRLPLVVARESEFQVDDREGVFATDPCCPELYFSRDMTGYGWCVRKQRHLNVGFGQLDTRALPKTTNEFVSFLETTGRVPRRRWEWHGHAYALNGASPRAIVGDGVVLVGDAAGLAYAQSGEGIRPAIESGLLAASAILEARGRYDSVSLAPYERRLRSRLPSDGMLGRMVPASLRTALAARLLRRPAFVRHVVLDRWFLHVRDGALAA